MALTIEDMRKGLEEMNMTEYISSAVILEKCTALLLRSEMNLADFLGRLEAFLLNLDSSTLSLEQMGQFENTIINECHDKRGNAGPNTAAKSYSNAKAPTSPELITSLGKRPSSDFKTPKPAVGSKRLVTAQTASDQKEHTKSIELSLSQGTGTVYSDRQNIGQAVVELNTKLGTRGKFTPTQRTELGWRCDLQTKIDDFDNIWHKYRFMFTPLDERAYVLDKRLHKIQSELCTVACLPETDLQPVGVPSQDTIWVCGRICCEAADGRINKTSVVLEGDRKSSRGCRVHLDLQDLPSYALFPGQIVLVQGVNSNGRKMLAKRIVEGAMQPLPTTPVPKLLEYHHSKDFQDGKPLQVVTAAGPFTTSDALDYTPLEDLLINVLKAKPDVLVLTGPFVDISQPLLASGNVELEIMGSGKSASNSSTASVQLLSYEKVFVEQVVGNLRLMFDDEEDYSGPLPTQIIIVPSLLDAHHEFVFPQPPFDEAYQIDFGYPDEPVDELKKLRSERKNTNRRVHFMPNPCMFRINEILFGVCSNDVLFSLSSDEVSHGIEGNRLARLAGHLIMQQSFCPQFPAPSSTLAQFDLRYAHCWDFKTRPDILLLPSRLAPLARDVCGTLVVNSGPLTKGVGGGTYADIHIHPHKESDLRSAILVNASNAAAGSAGTNGKLSTGPQSTRDISLPNQISSRTAVTIKKI